MGEVRRRGVCACLRPAHQLLSHISVSSVPWECETGLSAIIWLHRENTVLNPQFLIHSTLNDHILGWVCSFVFFLYLRIQTSRYHFPSDMESPILFLESLPFLLLLTLVTKNSFPVVSLGLVSGGSSNCALCHRGSLKMKMERSIFTRSPNLHLCQKFLKDSSNFTQINLVLKTSRWYKILARYEPCL